MPTKPQPKSAADDLYPKCVWQTSRCLGGFLHLGGVQRRRRRARRERVWRARRTDGGLSERACGLDARTKGGGELDHLGGDALLLAIHRDHVEAFVEIDRALLQAPQMGEDEFDVFVGRADVVLTAMD